MKIRILSDVCDEVRSYTAGEVVDLPNDKAARFVAVGVAEETGTAKATTKAAPEAAALEDEAERATLPPAKKRGG